MNNNYYAVIMAGGVGSRFWPVSTEEFPKQFHDMLGTGSSLIQKTFERINELIPSENILIATNQRYKKQVIEQLPNVSDKNILLEPAMRNTAPCILYSALKIYTENPDAVLLIAPSDHWIEKETVFLDSLRTSFQSCAKDNILMTLGIQPDHPNTGYGYIQFEKNSQPIKKVKDFTEKPDLEKAKKFISTGNYLWNAGIFVWSAKSILQSFQQYLPEMYTILDAGTPTFNTELENDFIVKEYPKCQNISIDFGIMEHANNVYVLPVDFGWSDLGTWGSLYNKLSKDDNLNAIVGPKTVLEDANGNMIKTKTGKKVIINGISDYIIVESDDTLLIYPKNKEQEIKQIASKAKNI